MLHEEEKLTHEATMREQAVNLLLELRKDPYQLPYAFRNLLNRTRQISQWQLYQPLVLHRRNKK